MAHGGLRGPAGLARLRVAALGCAVALLVTACGSLGSGPNSSPRATPPAGSLLVGTWQMTVTKDDLRQAGFTDPGLLNENSGRFTKTYKADGTWTSAQESLDGSQVMNPVWRGSYTVEGDELRAEIDFPTAYQGDLERYRWTIDGGELHLTMLEPADDPIARIGAEAHPWTRTGP